MKGNLWMEIRNERKKGLSYTEIARKHHIDPRTAKKYANSDTKPVYTLTAPKPSKLDPYKHLINSKIHTVIQSAKKAKALYEGQSKEIADKLSTDIDDSISAGMMIRVDEAIVKPLSHLEVQYKKIDELLNSVQALSISRKLQEECLEIRRKAYEITNDGFIDNYYAMTVLPFVKKCKGYDEQLAEYGEEFEELTSKHRYYSEYLGLPVVQFVFSMDKIETLKHEVKELEHQCNS